MMMMMIKPKRIGLGVWLSNPPDPQRRACEDQQLPDALRTRNGALMPMLSTGPAKSGFYRSRN